MDYIFHLLVGFEIYVLVALSLNLLIGYSGLLQVAHAAYFGVGAYVSALLTMNAGIGFFPALVCAGIAAGLSSLLVALPAWRFRGDYFVMISLAVQVSIYSLIHNCAGVTNGPYGITGIPRPAIFGSHFATPGSFIVLYGIIMSGLAGFLGMLKMSPFGRSLKAMREDELAAKSIGIPVRKLKLQAFMIACGIVGVAGGMYGSYVTFIDPTSFSLDASILMLSMVIVGGTGNVRGPIVGAAVLIAIPEVLRFFAMPNNIAANVRLLVYGLLLMVMMHLRPQGIAGRYKFE